MTRAEELYQAVPEPVRASFDQLCELWLGIDSGTVKPVTVLSFEALANELLGKYGLEVRAGVVSAGQVEIQIAPRRQDNGEEKEGSSGTTDDCGCPCGDPNC